ncbi:MAG: GGDEF domain-containing protein [Myxococcota bacterium]|nr:GGDEF domain-containing protein [Myxococcota bacterium]
MASSLGPRSASGSFPTNASAASAPSPRELDIERLERAVDTLGQVLTVLGDYAFDTDKSPAEETRTRFTQLARHVFFGATSDSEAAGPPSRRDWASALKVVRDQRREEQDFVVRGIGNLRQALQAFASCLSASVAEEHTSDAQIERRLGALRRAIEGNDTEAIREEAQQMASAVESSIDRRRQREREQLSELGGRVQTLRSELAAVRTQATLDSLTNLYNRAAFDQEVEKVGALALLLGSMPCLLLVDVDHFKAINDQYGHPFGDQVLKAVSENLVRHFLRKEDFVARYGGEEFAIVVREGSPEKVAERAERMREAQFAHITRAGDVEARASISIGIATLKPGESPTSWVQRADAALYAAKRGGRNRSNVA